MIIPKDSPLCELCSKVVDCPCECHIKDICSGQHHDVYSLPIDYKVRKEGKGPKRMDFILMETGKIPFTLEYKFKKLFKLL